jgi:hypothetical protein
MSRKFLTNIDLNKNQLISAVVHNLPTTSANALPNVAGQIYYDSTTNTLNYNNGSGWVTTGGTFGTGTPVLASTGSAGSATTYARFDHTHTHDGAAHNLITLNDLSKSATLSADLVLSGSYTITVAKTPSSGNDVANKTYVDTVATGMNAHDAVAYATTGALGTTGNLVGGTITTTASSPTLTIATSSNWTSITIDGQSLTAGDRVLIKDQAAAAQNGIYTVTSVGAVGNTTSFVFTRAADADTVPELGAGDFCYILAGTTNAKFTYVQTAVVSTVGSSAVNYTVLSNGNLTSIVTAGQGGTGTSTTPTTNYMLVGNGTSYTVTAPATVRSNIGAAGKYAVANPSITVAIGGTASWTVNHALNSVNVIVQVRSGDVAATGGIIQDVDVTYTDANNVTLQWISTTTNIAAGQYTVTVLG